MAYVIAPDGSRGQVPDDQLQQALQEGYTVDEKRAQAAESPVRTFAERALSTLTLGASDEVLAGAMGAPYKDFSGKTQQAGFVDESGQLKERAEANPIAALAGSIGGAFVNPASRISGAATTVKGAVALGAVEGGLFGLGSAVTADALGDRQALTEQLAARVGAGALTGGLISGGVQSVVSAGNRAALALEGAELPKRLADFADQAGAVVRKDRITDDAALEAAGLEWKAVDKWARRNGIFNRATSPDAMWQQAGVALKDAEVQVADALVKLEAINPGTRVMAADLSESAIQKVWKIDRDIGEQLERGVEGMRVGAFLRGQLEKLDTGADFGNAAAAAAPAMVLGGPVAALKAGGAVLAGQAVRKRAPFVVAQALDALADNGALKPIAESFLTQLKVRLNTMPELLGPFRAVLENAAAEGAASALATHIELARSDVGDEYLSTMGLPRETAADVPAVAAKASALVGMSRVQMSVEERLGDVFKAINSEREEQTPSEADFWKAYESVQKLRESPPVDDKLSMFPDIAMGVTAKLAEAAQHVYDAAPKPPDAHLPAALQQPWEPTPQERADFMRVTKAAFQPLDAIEDVMYGQPAQKTMETLAALYPRLLEQATQRMFERLTQDKPLSYQERLRLQPFLGSEALGLSPLQAQAIAAVHEKASMPAQQGARVDGRQAVNQNQNYDTQSQRIEARRSKS